MFSNPKFFFQRNIIFALSLNFLFLSSLFTVARAAGEVDPTFNATVQRFAGEGGISMAIQPDGKVLVVGNFTYANLVARSAVVRFNPDSTLDTSFDSGDLIGGTYGYIATVVKLQPDGKIIVAGGFTSIGGVIRKNIARLNANGSVDTSFNPVDIIGTIDDVEFLPDGRMILAGSFTATGNGGMQNRLARLNADGTLDNTFTNAGGGPELLEAAILPDGKILVGGSGFLHRYSANGVFETALPVNGSVNAISILPNGQALIGGTFTFYNGFTQGRIARINADGTLDTSFNTNGVGFNNSVFDISIVPDGKIIVVGNFTTYNNISRSKVARLNADGTLDTGFTYSPEEPNAVPIDAEALSDGGAYILYNFTTPNTLTRRALARLLTNGAVNDNFTPRLGTFGAVYKMLYLPDGKVLVGGEFDAINGVLRRGLARLNSDGSFDQTFNINITTNGLIAIIYDIAPQPDGKFIIAGAAFSSVNGHPTQVLARINPNGTTDTTFTSPLQVDSIVKSVALEPDGKILIGGTLRIPTFGGIKGALRLNPNGTVDGSFNPNINSTVNRLLRQPDGKILIGGEFTNVNGSALRGIARLLADGALDPTFNPPGGANDGVLALAFQADGKVIIGGRFTAVNGINRAYLARFNADGTFDAGFTAAPNYYVYDIAVQPNGKILVGGEFIAISNAATSRYARLNADGSIDTGFNIGSGANTFVFDIELQPDGKILLGGNFTRIQNQPRGGVARLLNANPPRALFDYNGDGKSDISVFRPSSGFWYIARPTGIPSQNFDAVQFGVNGDLPVPADYDGDGKTDVAVWRPSDGVWYILQSTAGFRAAQFGANGDIPVPGDFDSDGKANLAVFRPSTGAWYIARATGVPSQNFDTVLFGADGDKPIAGADFDGDGRADVTMFRPSTGDWYRINSSSQQYVAIHFGVAEDKPVAADYDGDGKTDLAVYRPSDGVWYRINSGADTFSATQFGIAEDRPSPADYDGDGKADLAVFRPSDGIWYLVKSTSGFSAAQFGTSGDIPTPNSFIR